MKTEPVVIIREATAAELPSIVRLLADDDFGANREVVEEPLSDSYQEAFAALKSDPNSLLVVAEKDGEIVGCLQLTVIRGISFQGLRRAQIEDVRVARRLRGAGIGQQLIAWAETEAQQRGCRMLQLLVHKERIDARRFYLSLGLSDCHLGMRKLLD